MRREVLQRPKGRSAVLATGAAALLLGAALAPGTTAAADTAPAKGTPATVTADALPTWQVNGVVWSMATVGNTVYATGNFTKARPPGTKAGDAREVARKNILAFDITTGNLITSFDHSLDGQGLRVAASPDGKRVYVGGEFTTVDGKAHSRLAAFDTATGALVAGFAPKVSNKVRAIAATNSTVYFGGNFFNVNGKSRTRLAAVKASDGTNVDTWKPTADDDEVFALALSPDADRVIIGGRFQTLNGAAHVGVGAVSAANGASVAWSSRPIPAKQGSAFSYVTDLQQYKGVVYGAADGEGTHWFDGRFAAKADTGDLVWLDNCYGATYGIKPYTNTVYSVSHAHDCSSAGTFRETTPRTWHRALSETTKATGTDHGSPSVNSNYSEQPIPTQLHWYPTLAVGSFTQQDQAAWSITGNSSYLALGGEFPSVNGRAQQGLVRFAAKAKSTPKVGPVKPAAPSARRSLLSRKVTVTWKATWDQDNASLTYTVLRDGKTAVGTVTRSSSFWNLPSLSLADTAPPAGKHTYTVKAADADGNTATSAASRSVG
ncbi:hypothetical protein [Actinomadura parmotrematis]|uniref:Fibronectin type-III domain-containing protein n=1 Tax=Actinomadura parmotrematis TaxID=2864039 RepID=A0ABS7FMK1_9ACTN|nr:hypothetical protein [Actinomadura parmotrematis]MBW8481609.1 hypothetical protein [Actinomadura parmotrematis]